jgi:hypothetical protein
MGLMTTGGKFCYIQCDERDCGKKVHHYGEEILEQSARLLGWENRSNKWACPSCLEKRRKRKKRSSKSGHDTSHDLTV